MHQYTKCWTIILKTTTKGSPYIPIAKARSFTALFGKNKQAMIQDIHAELRCNNQSKTINLFSHVTKLLGNINIFDFIGIDNHSRFSNKILRFCLVQEI